MKVSIRNEYLGRNIYLDTKALLLELNVEGCSGLSDEIRSAEAYARLSTILHLPELDFSDAATVLAAGLAAVVSGLQELVNNRSFKAKILPSEQSSPLSQIVCECRDIRQSYVAVKFGVKIYGLIINSPGLGSEKWFRQMVEGFIQEAGNSLDQTTSAILAVAERKGIPWFRVSRLSRVIQIGQSCHARRIVETITSQTGIISQLVSVNKMVTADVLSPLGIPMPEQIVITDDKQLFVAAEKIGYPLVVKPISGTKGEGITVGITTRPELLEAYHRAQQVQQQVILEGCISGKDHQALLVKGKLIAVAQREPAGVKGDGQHSVEQLVEITNRDPRRGYGFEKLMAIITLDERSDNLLASRGIDRKYVPQKGEFVRLQGSANISTGGTAIDLTEEVHPENKKMLERAARAMELDVAGIDFISPDIAKPYGEVGGAICKVKVNPGLRVHEVANKQRDVVTPIFESIFQSGEPGTIPIVAVTGSSGKTTVCRMLSSILSVSGHIVGMTTTDGAYVGGRLTLSGDVAGPKAAIAILKDPDVTCAVFETSRGGLINYGIGYGTCDVAVVLNVREDHLGTDGVETLDDMARVKLLVAQSARDVVVLNADDERCVAMAEKVDSRRICYVSINGVNPVVKRHVESGGLAMLLDMDRPGQPIGIIKSDSKAIIDAVDIPATFDGTARHNSVNALFAAAAAYCMGCSEEHIRRGLKTFSCNYQDARGRMNIYEGHPFTVIMDFAHNPDKVSALAAWVNKIKGGRNCIAVLTSPGNRQDEHFDKLAASAVGSFDQFVCSPWGEDYRGRGPLEVQELLRDGLIAHGVAVENIFVGGTEPEAVQLALEMAEKGDLLVVCTKSHERTWNQIVNFRCDEN